MSDLHTDGNGIAGLLSQVLAIDATSVARTCHACTDRRPIADHRAYHGAGVVLRCPSCEAVALCIGIGGERLTVELRGTFEIEIRQP